MICYRCHGEIPDQSNFCNLCGVKQEFFCKACGHLLVAGSVFCNQCGTKMMENTTVLEQVKAQELPVSGGESTHIASRTVREEVQQRVKQRQAERALQGQIQYESHTQGAETPQTQEEKEPEVKEEAPAFDLKNHLRQRMEESRSQSPFPEHKQSQEKEENTLEAQGLTAKKRRLEAQEGVGRYRETPVEKFIFSNTVLIGLKDKAVKNVVVPSFVTSISHHAFRDCTAINEVMLPDSVEIIGKEAFIGCSNLRRIILSKALRIIGNGTFMGCESLGQIKIPESVVTIGDMAFYGCKTLLYVDVENKKARIGSYVFSGCPWVETLE